MGEHKYKEKLLERLKAQLGEIKESNDKLLNEQKKNLESRILIYQKEIKQQKARIETFKKTIEGLEKEKCHAMEQTTSQSQRVGELNKILDCAHKELEKISMNLNV